MFSTTTETGKRKKTLLIISQVYIPDPTGLGQHMADAAAELVKRGHRVIVYTSARGYNNPSQKYKRRETIHGVEIRRLPLSSFGKGSIKIRLAGHLVFLIQVMLRALFLPRIDKILVSTSPPMAAIAALFIRFFRRVPIVYWVMDLNPDQSIAMGAIKEQSLPSRMFDAMNRAILRQAKAVISMDRFMAERLERKITIGSRLKPLPPWPLEGHLEPIEHADNPFRKDQGLDERFVIMHSGNITPAHPVTTILEAAKRLQTDEPRLLFLFIGDGNGKKLVDQFIENEGLKNVRILPYQPLEMIKFSLSSADVHLVVMGDEMVGIVHPCKVYGAMAVARPILFLGKKQCHVGAILEEHCIGWRVEHGDVDGTVTLLRQMIATDPDELARMGRKAQQVVGRQFSRKDILNQFCTVVENA